MPKRPEQFRALAHACIFLAKTASSTEEQKWFADQATNWLNLAEDSENQPSQELADESRD
jgi:hypothetical protein